MHVPPFILALAAIATTVVVVRLRVKIAHALSMMSAGKRKHTPAA